MITKFFTEEYYKGAAFKKMASFKANDIACEEIRGRRMDSATKARLLNDIAFLRQRYTGQAELPKIVKVDLCA